MFTKARRTITVVAAFAALALGGSAIAGAASNGSTTASSGAAASAPQGAHVGADGKQEKALSGDTAAKVEAAALAELPGGTIERVETDVDHGSPYEAHVRKADGTSVEVLVNESFAVTAVNAMQGP
jgi:uncharacterized membrane protein YkoI